MEHVGAAVRLFRREPRLWRYVWTPLLVTLATFAALFAVGFLAFDRWIRGVVAEGPLRSLAEIGFVLVALVVGVAAYFAVVALCSSFLWERLTEEVERLEFGRALPAASGCGIVLADTVARLFFTLFMALVGLACGSAVPVVGGVLVAGVVALFDFTANAYLRRGVTLSGQFSRVFRLPGAAGFGLTCGLLTLIPIVNVLTLPLLVTAATIMVARHEQG